MSSLKEPFLGRGAGRAYDLALEAAPSRRGDKSRSHGEHDSMQSPFGAAWPQSFDTSAQLLARRPPPALPTAKAIYTEMMGGTSHSLLADHINSNESATPAGQSVASTPTGHFSSTHRSRSHGRPADGAATAAISVKKRVYHIGDSDDETLPDEESSGAKLLSSSDPYSGKRHLFKSKSNREGKEYQLPSIISGESLQDLAMTLDTLREQEKNFQNPRLPSVADSDEGSDGLARSVVAPSHLTSALGSTATLAMLFDYGGTTMASVSQYVAEVLEIEDSDVAKTSYAQALLNSCNFMLGVGTMSIPYFVCNMGWIGALVLVLFAFLTSYTGLVIGWCTDKVNDIRSFPDLAHAGFGLPGRYTTTLVLYFELLMCLCVFLVLMGESLHQLFGGSLGLVPCIILSAVIAGPTAISKDMTIFSYFSIAGLFMTFGALVAFLVVSISSMSVHGLEYDVTRFTNKASYIPVGVPAIMFLFSGHAIFPSIKTNMRRPEHFGRVVAGTYAICLAIGVMLSVMGYLLWGASGPVPTNLLHVFPGAVGRAIAAVVTFGIPFCKFGLALNPVASGLEELMPMAVLSNTLYRKVNRVVIVATLVVVVATAACCVPFLDLIESLVGALCSTLVAVLIPLLCSVSIRGRGGLSWWEWPLTAGMFLLFGGVLIAGTGGASWELYKALTQG